MHDSWQNQLPLYVAGLLPASQREALEQHLTTCEHCQRDVRLWHDVAQAVHDDVSRRVLRDTPPPLAVPAAHTEHQGHSLQRGNHRVPNPATENGNISPISTRAHPVPMKQPWAIQRIAGIALTLMAVGAAIVLLAVFANAKLSPESAGVVSQFSGPTPAAPLTPIPIPTPSPTPEPEPVMLDLSDIRDELQTWNNDGPATLAMALSYFGWSGDQTIPETWLRPNPEDKSVTPWQMVDYIESQTNYAALIRMGGTLDLLKQMLAADLPVMVQTGFYPDREDWMGHYLLLVGYDDDARQFLTFDSYLGSNQGQGRPVSYSEFDDLWKHFNRTWIVLYQPARHDEVIELLGEYAEAERGYWAAVNTARREIYQDQEDKWAWFNTGTAYTALEQYDAAIHAFDQAQILGMPFRMMWYQFGPYEAYYQKGDYARVLNLAQVTQNTTEYVEESYYWAGMAYLAQDNLDAAVEQFQHALRLNPNFQPAQAKVN